LFAYSLDKGDNFHNYDGYELGNWDKGPPKFGGMKFDAIYSSHFIEHIRSAEDFVHWVASRLKPGGRVYIEWPSHESQFCPSIQELSPIGFGRITANFHDDLTHTTLPATEDVIRYLQDCGLTIDVQGIIRLPLFEEELLANHRDTGDIVALQFAYWLRTGWCQYVTAHMPEANID
jgi:SAM-dependent methyltransferase